MAATQSADTAGLLHDRHAPSDTAYATYQREIYASLRPPLFSADPAQWETLAARAVPAAAFGYVAGSAGRGRTAAANGAAFDRYRLVPRMLVDATRRDVSIELFGRTLPSPLLVGPIGVQEILHSGAEEATARACSAVGVPFVLSTAASRSIEQVATANGTGERWFQLYWPKPEHDDITASLLARARAAKYTTLVVTADTFSLGWRPTDLDRSYLPFVWGQGCANGFSDPVFARKYLAAQRRAARRPLLARLQEALRQLLRPHGLWTVLLLLWHARTVRKSRAWLDVVHSGTYRAWSDLATLRKHWPGPILIKGIQCASDARAALAHGADGLIVSNHGGRQSDGARASLDALAEVTADEEVSKSGKPVLFDSGVRTGSDVLVALALGARAVLLGRPAAYGLAIAGQAGVEHVLRCTLADMDNTLGLIGKTSVRELGREDLEIAPRIAQ